MMRHRVPPKHRYTAYSYSLLWELQVSQTVFTYLFALLLVPLIASTVADLSVHMVNHGEAHCRTWCHVYCHKIQKVFLLRSHMLSDTKFQFIKVIQLKGSQHIRLTITLLSVSRMSIRCGSLDISQPYGPTGISILPSFLFFKYAVIHFMNT